MKQKSVKRRKKARKLVLAVLMLLLSGGLLATSSYAWFTANKTVTVNQINVDVAAANGLQLSVDGVEWKPVISNEDILKTITGTNYVDNKNQFPTAEENGVLSPVSTVGNIDSNGQMEMYFGSIEADETTGEFKLTATKDAETKGKSGHFIAFDLFVQTNAETDVYLTDKSSVKGGEGVRDTGIQNAARVAFIDLGTAPAGSNASVVQALNETGAVANIWEPNYDVHKASGVANAAIYGKTGVTQTDSARLGYYGIKAPITVGVPLNSTDTYFEEVTTDETTPATYFATKAAGIPSGAYQNLLKLGAGITKIRIYMWVEGQDVDCENYASGGKISFDLQFSTNDKQ